MNPKKRNINSIRRKQKLVTKNNRKTPAAPYGNRAAHFAAALAAADTAALANSGFS